MRLHRVPPSPGEGSFSRRGHIVRTRGKGTGTGLFHASTCVTFAAVPVAVTSLVHDQALVSEDRTWV